jgi:pentose-5-phosphate-3-epimerase
MTTRLLDRGVKLEHCKPLAAHGALVLVAGSAVFERDPGLEVRRTREAALST